MLQERVSDNIYVFTSDLYAQVTAGAIVTRGGAILVDSLPFPAETLFSRHVKSRPCCLCQVPGLRGCREGGGLCP